MNDNVFFKAEEIIFSSLDSQNLKKIVFSQSTDHKIKKAVATPVQKDGKVFLKMESFTTDNKALTELVALDDAKNVLLTLMQGFFRQTNVFTSTHEHQLKISR